jgi:hypothetical protein
VHSERMRDLQQHVEAFVKFRGEWHRASPPRISPTTRFASLREALGGVQQELVAAVRRR